jgi:hypothetical protein
MKATNKFILVILSGAILSFASCDDDDDDENITTFKAVINGAVETPANASTATGTATLTFNNDTKIFNIVVQYSGVNATMAHIHKGEVGVAGSVIFGFDNPASPINYTSPVLDATQEADLMANLYYVNIHSAQFPGGEIRGQLIKQ